MMTIVKRIKYLTHTQQKKPSVSITATRQRQRVQPLVICLLGICGSLLVLTSLFPVFLNFTGSDLLEMHKCPACYGITMCPAILAGEIVLKPFYQLRVAQALNGRNVYFGNYNKKEVVLKKLGTNAELEALDEQILERAGHKTEKLHVAIRLVTQKHLHMEFTADSGGGIGGSTVHHLLHPNETTSSELDDGEEVRGSNLLTCPSQRKLLYVEDKVYGNNCGQNRLTVLHNIMTMLLMNTEPLIFQAFPAEEGWPFPTYIGACGRLVIEEYAGDSLRAFTGSATFEQRARMGYRLLKIADKLTDGTADFRIYVTDLSLDNVAVAKDGSPKIIDGENIVVADLQKIRNDKPPGHQESYSSKSFGCPESDPDCFSYSEENLCNRLVNDHNYFAFCHAFFNIKGYNILENPPAKFSSLYPEMPVLLDQCLKSDNRVAAVRKIQDILADFLNL